MTWQRRHIMWDRSDVMITVKEVKYDVAGVRHDATEVMWQLVSYRSSWILKSCQQYGVTSGWIPHSKFSYASSKLKSQVCLIHCYIVKNQSSSHSAMHDNTMFRYSVILQYLRTLCINKYLLKISVKHILRECPITTELFQKNGYGFNACNNVRDILYNTDIIYSIVKLIVHSPVGKLV